MRRISRVLLLPALTAGCIVGCDSKDDDFFDEPRVYGFDLVEAQTGTPVETVEECAAVQADPENWVNCWRTAVFCPDGRVWFMLTDIQNRGTYTVDDRFVHLEFPVGGEAPDRGLIFQLAKDRQTAELFPLGEIWELWDDARAELEARVCVRE